MIYSDGYVAVKWLFFTNASIFLKVADAQAYEPPFAVCILTSESYTIHQVTGMIQTVTIHCDSLAAYQHVLSDQGSHRARTLSSRPECRHVNHNATDTVHQKMT